MAFAMEGSIGEGAGPRWNAWGGVVSSFGAMAEATKKIISWP
jgi:hypothetical protein